MNKRSAGFATIEILIATVVILAISGIGWYVYQSRSKNSTATQQKQNEAQAINSQATSTKETIPAGYKLYEDKENPVTFYYPESWATQPLTEEDKKAGTIANLVSPEVKKALDDFLKTARGTEGPARNSLVVSRWKSMNNSYAKGGEWIDQKQYASLEEYFSDPSEFRSKQKVGELTIGGQKAYEVIISGVGATYGIMLERPDGFYQFEFPTIYDKAHVTQEATTIINSIKFQ